MNEIALYIIAEGQIDASIIHTLLDCTRFRNVYHIPAGGFNNLASMATTIRLMRSPLESDDKILVAFDADSEKQDVIDDRIATMRYLTGAEYDNRIEVFCFSPTIEQYLFSSDDRPLKNDRDKLADYLRQHIEELREKEVIMRMQDFINQ